jgi:hypothetical protein
MRLGLCPSPLWNENHFFLTGLLPGERTSFRVSLEFWGALAQAFRIGVWSMSWVGKCFPNF